MYSDIAPPPKKIKAILDEHGIIGVVSGYFSVINYNRKEVASYTAWDKDGQVVCVLAKPRKDEWVLVRRKSNGY